MRRETPGKRKRGRLESETYSATMLRQYWRETDEASHLKVTSTMLDLDSYTLLFLSGWHAVK